MATYQKIPIGSESPDPTAMEISLLNQIDKLDRSILPPELQVLDIDKLKDIYKNGKSVSILVTGKVGTGKSSLTNGILGLNLRDRAAPASRATRDSGVEACTTRINMYQAMKGTVKVTVWDSPGLQDGTGNQKQYLRNLKRECSGRDLTLYCIKLDIRFVRGDDNPDVLAMKKLTQTFGTSFWETTIIVLTFANTLGSFNEDWEDLTEEQKVIFFSKKIHEWTEQIRSILIRDVQVPRDVVRAIRVIPAGSWKKPHLPGVRYWLSNLWCYCIDTIPTPEACVALVRINAHRLIMEEEVERHNFRVPIENQPIVSNAIARIGRGASREESQGESIFTWLFRTIFRADIVIAMGVILLTVGRNIV